MSNHDDRAKAPVRRVYGDNPALGRADVRAACKALRAVAWSLVGRGAYQAFCRLADPDGWLNIDTLACHPSQATMARALKVQRTTVSVYMAELERAKLITRIPRMTRTRGRLSDAYALAFELVGRPEFRWKPRPDEPQPQPARRKADGTFKGRRLWSAPNGAEAAHLVEVKANMQARPAELCGDRMALAGGRADRELETSDRRSSDAKLDGEPLAVAAGCPLALSPRALAAVERGRLALIAQLPARQSSAADLLSRLEARRGR